MNLTLTEIQLKFMHTQMIMINMLVILYYGSYNSLLN